MTHLLDTNSCVDHLRRGPSSNVTAKLAAATPGSVVLCSVVLAELLYGAYRSARQAQTLAQVQAFCSRFVSLPTLTRVAVIAIPVLIVVTAVVLVTSLGVSPL